MTESFFENFIQQHEIWGLFLFFGAGILFTLSWLVFRMSLPRGYLNSFKAHYEKNYESTEERKYYLLFKQGIVSFVFRDTDLRRLLKPSWASELNDSVKFSNICLWSMRLTFAFLFVMIMSLVMMFIPGLFGAQ